jgi:hypothetical protein
MKTDLKNKISATFFAFLITGIVYCAGMIIALFFEDPTPVYWMGGMLCGITYLATFMIYYEKKESVAHKFFISKELLFSHVGFKPDWVEYAIDDCTEMYWRIDAEGNNVSYSKSLKSDVHSDDFYRDRIYTQRFYSKWVYRGKDVTMIFCDPGVDGTDWFRIFDNKKEQK